MKQIGKRLASLVAALAVALSLCPLWGQEVEAMSAVRYAWRDELGNIILQTSDHRKTSSVHYKTVGWTITRCVLGTREPIEEQYLTVRFNDALEDVGDEWTQSTYMLSEAELLSRIAAVSGEWLADIQSKKTCYLKFDAVMVCVDDSEMDFKKYSGSMDSEENQAYTINPWARYPGVWDKFNYEDLMYHTYDWYSPKSIETHYDIYLLYNGGEEPEPEVSTDWYRNIYWFGTMGAKSEYNADNTPLIDSSLMKPRYKTWNTSEEYDLSEGIPSGEDITNGIGVDTWCGYERVSRYEETRWYVLSYDLTYTETVPVYETAGGTYVTDGNGEKIQVGTEDIECHVPVSFTVSRTADYYYAAALSLYELDGTDVYNSVYPGDNIHYQNSRSANIKTILDGVPDAAETSAAPKPEEHIRFPEPYTQTIRHDCGTKAGVQEYIDQLNVYLYDDVIDAWDYIKGVSAWNDLVEIDGTKYLDDAVVTHANDTRKVRESQGSAFKTEGALKFLETCQDDYLYQEDGTTVTIPKDVANGAYATEVEVVYHRKAVNDHGVRAWSSTDEGDNIYNHIKEGYEKNEPVQVHTPVIAPVTITDGEKKTQLVTENKTQTPGDLNKDGTAKDGKALYELILDNEYTFRFDPALHRDIQGYGWADETLAKNYNKYVKNKWVRFPFTVQLLDNETGEWSSFYDIGADGYTEWIPIYEEGDYLEPWFSNETKFYIPSWALESSYYEIEYKVEAYNVMDENGTDHSGDTEDEANRDYDYEDHTTSKTKYVATYKVPVELSGIIYNFEILGSVYFEDYNFGLNEGEIAFCPREMEKKQGNKNRLGGNAVRYTRDGHLTNNWKAENTLPMAMGNSPVWDDRGYLLSGDTFAFSVKTIANLWDEEIDWIDIEPTYRWFEADGTEHKDLQIYYWDDSERNQLIRVGSEQDKKEMITWEDDSGDNEFSFASAQHQGSLFDADYYDSKEVGNNALLSNDPDAYQGDYHDPDLHYTLAWHNLHYEETWTFGRLMYQPSLSHCMSSIHLNSKMRVLTGKYEELARNAEKERRDLEKFDNLTEEQADKLRYSMQTWYGRFSIPQNMMICDADTFEKLGATDVNQDGVVDYWDYLVCTDGAVDKHADFWLNTDDLPCGYLMLNFAITTYNNGKEHLSYFGGTLDMWQKQGAKQTITIGNKTMNERSGGQFPLVDIPVISGDVALINPQQSVVDGYYAGYWFIN